MRLEEDPNASDEQRDQQWFRLLIAPEGESRRGICIITTSAIDDMLQTLINHSESRPVRGLDFNAKIDRALLSGLISSREASRCHIIRAIRNKFAHKVEPNFLSEPLKGMALSLFDTKLHGPKPDAFWVYYVSVQEICLILRKATRDRGLLPAH